MRIISDVDEVVVEYIQGFCDFWNDKTGASITYWDFDRFSLQCIPAIEGRDEEVKMMTEYLESKYFDNMRLVEGARRGINRLVKKHDVDFVTTRGNECRDKTVGYFDLKFPQHSFDIYFDHNCKLDKIRELRADVIIEDSPSSLKYADAGFKVLLFDKRWNRGVEHENIDRCFSWDDIVDGVRGLENV